jgi:hypothetical protein
MKRLLVVVTIAAVSVLATGLQAADKEPSWHFTADYIEACSCNLFCACFFNSGTGARQRMRNSETVRARCC